MNPLGLYVGCKIIQAEPMSEMEFLEKYRSIPDDMIGQEDVRGYHVIYPNPDGTLYHSWSPTPVFEMAYRPLSIPEIKMIKTF